VLGERNDLNDKRSWPIFELTVTICRTYYDSDNDCMVTSQHILSPSFFKVLVREMISMTREVGQYSRADSHHLPDILRFRQ
ncbi:hypothetical protein J6590_107195, partial [Homalodisca vitripennis]